jgi:hypothetical protein
MNIVTGLFALLAAILVILCAACSTDQIKATCVVDGLIQPVAIDVAAAVASTGHPVVGAAAGIDAAIVHPAVVAACAKLGGTPTTTLAN